MCLVGYAHSVVFSAQPIDENKSIYDLASHRNEYDDLATKWWSWWISLTPSYIESISNHTTQCPSGRDNLTIFLADPIILQRGEFNCTISHQSPIFFNVASEQCDLEVKTLKEKSDKGLLDCAYAVNPHAQVGVNLDGNELTNPNKYRILTKFFNITIPKINQYEADPGIWRSVILGTFVYLKPLPVGDHTLTLKVAEAPPSGTAPPVFSQITYKFLVQ
jgi:hypothetical protein